MARNHIVKAFGDTNLPAAPYVFREYPKHVTVNGITYTVESEDDEAELLASGTKVNEADERARLMKIAEQHELPVDGRWKIERIEKVIKNAGYDSTRNPFA